jgi:plastocyanin
MLDARFLHRREAAAPGSWMTLAAPVVLSAALLLSLLSPAVEPVRGAPLRGRVVLSHAPEKRPALNLYPGQVRAEREPGAEDRPTQPLVDVVVYLEGVEASLPPAAGGPIPEMNQIHQRFEPRVLPVMVGQEVRFPNNDRVYHNVFSISTTKKFDLGRYGTGEYRTVTFDRPGLVRVFCEIHSDMAGFVLVLPNLHFTKVKADGTYVLDDVPEGDHTLVIWHPEMGTQKRRVHVGSDLVVVPDLEL